LSSRMRPPATSRRRSASTTSRFASWPRQGLPNRSSTSWFRAAEPPTSTATGDCCFAEPPPRLSGWVIRSRIRLPNLNSRRSCAPRLSGTRTPTCASEPGWSTSSRRRTRARSTLRMHTATDRRPASWLLGCDGGRSAVRRRIGVAMRGVSYDQSWLVIDTVNDPHTEEHGLHYGEPTRPHVIVPGRDGRCRPVDRVSGEPEFAVGGDHLGVACQAGTAPRCRRSAGCRRPSLRASAGELGCATLYSEDLNPGQACAGVWIRHLSSPSDTLGLRPEPFAMAFSSM
jgi:hypothetical protein